MSTVGQHSKTPNYYRAEGSVVEERSAWNIDRGVVPLPDTRYIPEPREPQLSLDFIAASA